jgi:hypothetical protein
MKRLLLALAVAGLNAIAADETPPWTSPAASISMDADCS